MNVNNPEKRYSKLASLFGAYFHPEWREENGTKEAVITEFAKDQEIDTLIGTLIEIEDLKKQFPDDEKLKNFIERDLFLGYGFDIYLASMTAVQWLDFVASIIKQELNNRKPQR